MKLTIFIDLPPAAVTPHNKGGWKGKMDAVKEYRARAALAALAIGLLRAEGRPVPLPGKVRVHHAWYLGKTPIERQLGAKTPKAHKRYRPQDEGNAIQALKPAIDGLVDSGLLAGDRAEHVTWGEYRRFATIKEHSGSAFVYLELELLEGEKP